MTAAFGDYRCNFTSKSPSHWSFMCNHKPTCLIYRVNDFFFIQRNQYSWINQLHADTFRLKNFRRLTAKGTMLCIATRVTSVPCFNTFAALLIGIA